jgi:hypothetical protein
MNRIIFPLEPQMQGPEVADLQVALQLLLDRVVILQDNEGTRHELSTALQHERAEQIYGGISRLTKRVCQRRITINSLTETR